MKTQLILYVQEQGQERRKEHNTLRWSNMTYEEQSRRDHSTNFKVI